jgi:hypothetical protein
MNKERDILILLESFGENCEDINRSLALEGKRISTGLGGRLTALSIGKPLESHAKLTDAAISLKTICFPNTVKRSFVGPSLSLYRSSSRVFSSCVIAIWEESLPLRLHTV